ncbi:MAG: methyltransferase domain-containing protein [Rhizomicrobium sp.]
MRPDGDPLEHAGDLIQGGRAAEAARFLRERIASGRGGVLARTLLVEAELASGDIAAALDVAREAAALNPNVPQALVALGDALMAAGHLPAAIAEFHRALRLDPASVAARLKLGLAWLEAGEADKALEQFGALDAAEVSDLAAHIARAEAVAAQPRSDAGYVRHLFDQFSSDYDARMRGQLGYQAPEILRALADLVMPGARDLDILDLGCGTGLAGVAFAGLAAAIDGIDLSPAMIAKARARKLYRALIVGDIETAPGSDAYDLVVAADTLVYLGDLGAVFRTAALCLKPGGFFLFTVERTERDGFELGPKRRWRHCETYLRETAAESGFDVAGLVAASPRSEANVPVEGLAVALTKPS